MLRNIFIINLLIALSYFMTGRLGLTLASLPEINFTPLWMPSGIAVSALLIMGYRVWWGIALGAFCVEIVSHFSWLGVITSIGITTANVLQAVFVTMQIRLSLQEPSRCLRHTKGVSIFILASVIGTALTALLGTPSLFIENSHLIDNFWEIWIVWMISDLVGILIVAPFVLAWHIKLRSPPLNFWRLAELMGIFALLVLFSLPIFLSNYPIEYIYLPLLLWSAFRFGRRLTTLLVILISLVAAISTAQGMGAFVRISVNDSLILLQSFMGVLAISILYLSAVLSERRKAHKALTKQNDKLEKQVAKRTEALQQANEEIQLLNKKLQAENVRMSAELAVTQQLQQLVLPRKEELNNVPHLQIAGFMQPAAEVGGDYYDVLQQDGRLQITIGDVTGHGLESGVLMLMVQTALRTLLTCHIHNPTELLRLLNQVIYQNLQRMQSDKNLTLTLLQYQAGKCFVCGQHEEILLITQTGQVKRVDTLDLGFWIGVEPDIAPHLQQCELPLHAGGGVVLYTDGITEAMNARRETYSVARLCELIAALWQTHDTQKICDAIITDVKQHIGKCTLQDDMTLLVIKCLD